VWRRPILVSLALLLGSVGASAVAGSRQEVCGRPGKVACPLQAWMRQNIAAPLAKRDFDSLAKSFEQVSRLNPEPKHFSHWERLSKEGAAAARQKELAKLTSACSRCHELYRPKYIERHRERRIEN